MGIHEPAAAGGGGGGGGGGGNNNNNKTGFSGGWGLVAKLCDYCNCAAALLFCRTDSAFMCMACDSKFHDPNNKLGSKHERVWMCEVCEQAPASVTCKADAAALCVTCDRDIHSANPLAQRHERSPVVPFYETAESVVKSTASVASFLVPPMSSSSDTDVVAMTCNLDHHDIKLGTRLAHDSYVTDSWISSMDPTPPKVPADAPDLKSMEFLFSDSDNYLDFDYPINSSETRFQQQDYGSGTDGVVPVQSIKPPIPAQLPGHSTEKHFEIDFTKSQISSYNNSYNPQSISHSVSSIYYS